MLNYNNCVSGPMGFVPQLNQYLHTNIDSLYFGILCGLGMYLN